MMSAGGSSCWQQHTKQNHVMTSNTHNNWIDAPKKVFEIKAYLTVQMLKALQTFQQVDKYNFATKILNKEYDMHPRCICHADLHEDNILVNRGDGIYSSVDK